MDQIFANRLQVGFELRDCKGRYLGFAHTLTRAQRFAAILRVRFSRYSKP